MVDQPPCLLLYNLEYHRAVCMKAYIYTYTISLSVFGYHTSGVLFQSIKQSFAKFLVAAWNIEFIKNNDIYGMQQLHNNHFEEYVYVVQDDFREVFLFSGQDDSIISWLAQYAAILPLHGLPLSFVSLRYFPSVKKPGFYWLNPQ